MTTKEPHIRVFVDFAHLAMTSDATTFTCLAYQTIQIFARDHGGRFFLKDYQRISGLSEKTCKKHIAKLIARGWVERKGTIYFLKGIRKIINSKDKRPNYKPFTPQEITIHSWKNISFYRARLVTLIEAEVKKTQKAIAKGFNVMNLKDKCKNKIKDSSLKRWDSLAACSFTASLCNKSQGTISKYRRKQSLATYDRIHVRCAELDYMCSDVYYLDKYKEVPGKFYLFKGRVYFNAISRVTYLFRLNNRL